MLTEYLTMQKSFDPLTIRSINRGRRAARTRANSFFRATYDQDCTSYETPSIVNLNQIAFHGFFMLG